MKKLILVLITFLFLVQSAASDWLGNSDPLNDLKSAWVETVIAGEAVELLITDQILRTKIEIKLRLAGINISEDKFDDPLQSSIYLILSALEKPPEDLIIYHLRLLLSQFDGQVRSIIWESSYLGYLYQDNLKRRIIEIADERLDLFINDYLAAKQEAKTNSLQDRIDQAKKLMAELRKVAEDYKDHPEKSRSELEEDKLLMDLLQIQGEVETLSEEDREKYNEALEELTKELLEVFTE